MIVTNQHKLADRRLVRGQGMTEYIIIVALIAIASIGVVGAFGGVVKDQFVAMGKELSGDPGTAATYSGPEAGNAPTTLKNYTE